MTEKEVAAPTRKRPPSSSPEPIPEHTALAELLRPVRTGGAAWTADRCPVKACLWRGPCPLHRPNTLSPTHHRTEALMRDRHNNPPGRRPSIAATWPPSGR